MKPILLVAIAACLMGCKPGAQSMPTVDEIAYEAFKTSRQHLISKTWHQNRLSGLEVRVYNSPWYNNEYFVYTCGRIQQIIGQGPIKTDRFVLFAHVKAEPGQISVTDSSGTLADNSLYPGKNSTSAPCKAGKADSSYGVPAQQLDLPDQNWNRSWTG